MKPRESFHLDEQLRRALMECAANTDPPSNKTAIIVSALREYLTRKGFYPPPVRDK